MIYQRVSRIKHLQRLCWEQFLSLSLPHTHTPAHTQAHLLTTMKIKHYLLITRVQGTEYPDE